MAANQPIDVAALIQAIIEAANATAVANAAAAAAAAPPPYVPPPPPPPVPGPPPVPFALLPGDAFAIALDYGKPGDMKIFRSAIEGKEIKFNLKEEHLRVFLGSVKEQVRIYNWIAIMTIPDNAGVGRNLITNYGLVTLDLVRAHATTYIATESRNAQNSMMLYQFLLNSLTEDAKLVMETLTEQYHELTIPSGPLFLKALIGRASIDTKAKVLLLRESVLHLYMKMIELKGNIRLFNQHTSDLVSALAGRGQVVDELVMHLFKAYEQAPDRQFVRYVEAIRDRYDADLEDVTADQLMRLAVNKYKLMEQRNAMPIDNTEKIVALETKVTATPEKRDRKIPYKELKWRKEPPKTGQPTTKQVEGRTFHWCPKHKAWCIHTLADCTLPDKPDKPSAGTDDKDKDAADKLVIHKAYHAIIHESDDDDD